MLLNLQGAALSHDDTTVLHHVDFQVNENDFVYIIGKVGSGKSTLLKALYGEVPVQEGSAQIFDVDLTRLKNRHLPSLRRRLGIVFQDFQLLRHHTVEQNLDFVLRATGWKKKLRPGRIAEVLDMVRLADKAHCFPHELSGGEQQRVCIARALLSHPQVLLADEPIGSLDNDTARHIMEILRSAREQGTAIVMVTHNLNLLSEYPGIVYRCHNGSLEQVTNEYSATIELDA